MVRRECLFMEWNCLFMESFCSWRWSSWNGIVRELGGTARTNATVQVPRKGYLFSPVGLSLDFGGVIRETSVGKDYFIIQPSYE